MKKSQNRNPKVGIITWYNHGNCGGTLQAYALQTVLSRMGIEVIIINNQDGTIDDFCLLMKFFIGKIVTLLHLNCHIVHSYPFLQFNNRYLNISKRIYNYEELENKIGKLDCVICGSDQIWAPNVFKPEYMANFITDGKIKKISYAASIGLNHLTELHKKIYAQLLRDFYKISVREETAKKMLQEYCGIYAEVCPDPTLLLNREDYIHIEKKMYYLKKPFVFCYFLNANHQYKNDILQFIGREKNIIGFSKNRKDKSWMKSLVDLGPREFIWFIRNADMIFTDSYHGTIFSLLFHKEFYTFERFAEGDPVCQNSRLEQLKQVYGIDSHIIKQGTDFTNIKKIDYEHFENVREKKKREAVAFLNGALQ